LDNVFASRALCPSFPGALAAAASFFAGIFSPLLTPSDFLREPFLVGSIAFCIHFSAMSNAPRKIEGRGKIKLSCPACKKQFEIFRCHYRGATNACSKQCAQIIKPRKPAELVTCVCKICNKSFKVKKYRQTTALYCSRKCLADGRGLKMRGENHPLWKGGISARSYSSRKTIAQVIAERRKCEDCGKTTHLQGHHIKSHSSHPPGRTDPSNIQVLCKWCHANRHPRLAKFILSGRVHS
jgi:5-methylcytosine-specific restriction endonuclease McrA